MPTLSEHLSAADRSLTDALASLKLAREVTATAARGCMSTSDGDEWSTNRLARLALARAARLAAEALEAIR